MNPSSTLRSSSMAPVLIDSRERNGHLRRKILRNEEERLQLEQKLRSLMIKTMPTHQRRQVQHIQTYFRRLNDESQRAEQRNLSLLQHLTDAQQRLDQLHDDADHLIQLKNDYVVYLESHYPQWQRPRSVTSETPDEYDRLARQIHLHNDGNLRHVRQSDDIESSMLFKRYEDQLKVGFERSLSVQDQHEERSISESNEVPSNFSRLKRPGSLRMELTIAGLFFLLDYLDKEIIEMIDKKKCYSYDQPTLTQKRTIVDIGNQRDSSALKDVEPTITSMVILDQLPATIRRNTVHQCLITDEILSYAFSDFDKDSIAQMLPEQDRTLWLRLIEHFTRLLKYHVMDLSILVEKFALTLLTTNVHDLQIKARSLLKHIMQKSINNRTKSRWMKKPHDDDVDEDETISSSTSINQRAKTKNIDDQRSSETDYFN